jgi:hypothetical protein
MGDTVCTTDLKLILDAVDISKRMVELGECGSYPLVGAQLTGIDIFK